MKDFKSWIAIFFIFGGCLFLFGSLGLNINNLRTENTALKAKVTALKDAYDDQRLMTGKMFKTLTGIEIDLDSKWLVKED